MEKPASDIPSAASLTDLGAIRVRGADTVRFLQGQLSSDVTKLAATGSMLAGFHNPQGRVIALLRLISLAPEDILAILPRELASPVVARLSKYLLRAKAKIEDESAYWQISGLTAPPHATPADSVLVRIEQQSSRCWLLTAADNAATPPGYATMEREGWRALDIAAGLPQVYAATSEAFVAQMLNLDVLGAIAFDKGCYTGQEVIARAHYRGRVKRRMQRLQIPGAQLQPGDTGALPDGRSFKVVEAVTLADGSCDLLAVAAELAYGAGAED